MGKNAEKGENGFGRWAWDCRNMLLASGLGKDLNREFPTTPVYQPAPFNGSAA